MSDREHPASAPPDGAAEPEIEPVVEGDESPEPVSTLSPAVRRLIRQYDLDITGIHGSGPSGRIRVGDVIAILGGRAAPTQGRVDDPGKTIPAVDDPLDDRPADTPYRTSPLAASIGAGAARAVSAIPTSSVFECDVSRVLAHRKQQRRQNVDILLTSYYLVACSEALKLVPELIPTTSGSRPNTHLGVILNPVDGHPTTAVVDVAENSPWGSINDRLSALDASLRAGEAATRSLGRTGMLIHHHGLSGSLITTPTPIGDGHTASLGLGRVRRQIVVRTTDGNETPKIAALCYVTLSFYADRLQLHRASRFLSQLVRILEQWPE